jgi:hypothetical protein
MSAGWGGDCGVDAIAKHRYRVCYDADARPLRAAGVSSVRYRRTRGDKFE